MRLTDEQLHTLIVNEPDNGALLKELRWRIRWRIVGMLPNPRGFCHSGERVYADQKGAYSTGYIIHEGTSTSCTHSPIMWDADAPRTASLKALISELAE